MEVAVVGGAGTVGSTAAFALGGLLPDAGVRLVDVDADAAEGHAIDLRHAGAHAATPVGRHGGAATVDVRTAPPGPDGVAGADCVVMAASVPRPEGAAERGGRAAFLERNREVADEVAAWLGAGDPVPVVVVTNPVDPITHRLRRGTGWPRGRFLGYSLSETARLADALAAMVGTEPGEVSCPVMGEHGEHVVPVFSRATVGGEPLSLSPEQRRAAVEHVRDVPYDVIDLRGAHETSRWVTGRGVAHLVASLLTGGPDDPVCLSTPLAGEYGYDDVCLSVPVTLGPEGVESIHEWELSDAERERLDAAYRAVRPTCE